MELIETQFEDVTFWLNGYLLYHCAYLYIMIQLLNDSAAEGSFKSSAYYATFNAINLSLWTLLVRSLNMRHLMFAHLICGILTKKAHLSVAQITCNKAVYDYKFHKSVSIMLVKLIVDRKNENNELPSIYIWLTWWCHLHCFSRWLTVYFDSCFPKIKWN